MRKLEIWKIYDNRQGPPLAEMEHIPYNNRLKFSEEEMILRSREIYSWIGDTLLGFSVVNLYLRRL